jgi:hypothetical protein
MKDLLDINSGIYMNSMLLEALKEFNIKYNIIRLIIIFKLFLNY